MKLNFNQIVGVMFRCFAVALLGSWAIVTNPRGAAAQEWLPDYSPPLRPIPNSDDNTTKFDKANQDTYDQNRRKIDATDSGDGETQESENGTRTEEIVTGGGKRSVIPYLNPIEGASGTMNNQDALLMVSKAASSKIGLYNIVTNLTEPGVSQGINNTLSQSQGLWSNRIQAEQLFNEMIESLPEGQDLATARLNCYSQQLATGTPIDVAVARCAGGSKVVTANSSPGTSAPTAPGQAPSLKQVDPNHARYQDPSRPPGQQSVGDMTGSQCQGDDEVCGTDYLFNQEIRNIAGLIEPPFLIGFRSPKKDKAIRDLEQARLDFQDFIGDIRFKSKMENGNLQTISSSLVPPRAEGSVDLTILGQQNARYEDFNELMKLYCLWANNICTGSICSGGGLSKDELIKAQYPTRPGDNNPQEVSSEIRDFWRDARDAKPLRARLSTSTFTMHSKIVEDLYNLYKRDSSFADKTGSGPDGACGGFYTDPGEPANYAALYGRNRSSNQDSVNINAAWHMPIYKLSRMIGEASYLDFLGKMGARLQNTLITSAGLPSRVRIEMLNLINRAAVRRSKTGSVTIEEEMYTQSKAIQEAAIKMILEPARESTSISTSMQQQSFRGVNNSNAAPQVGPGGT